MTIVKKINPEKFFLYDVEFEINENRALFKVDFSEDGMVEVFSKDNLGVGLFVFFEKSFEHYLKTHGKYLASGFLWFYPEKNVWIFEPDPRKIAKMNNFEKTKNEKQKKSFFHKIFG